MKVKTIQCANFGAFGYARADIGGYSVLVSGDNGVGKTTLVDAMNTTLTLGGAANQYNDGGEEPGPHSRDVVHRTLPAYIMGGQIEGYLRKAQTCSFAVTTYQHEDCDGRTGYLHVGFLAEARFDARNQPTLVGEVRGFCFESQQEEFPRKLLWIDDDQATPKFPAGFKDFKLRSKMEGLDSQIAINEGKKAHIQAIAKFLCDRALGEDEAFRQVTASMRTLAIKSFGSPDDFAKQVLPNGAIESQGLAAIGEAASSFRSAEKELERWEGISDSARVCLDAAMSFVSNEAELQSARAEVERREAQAARAKIAELEASLEKSRAAVEAAERDQADLEAQIDSAEKRRDELGGALAIARAGRAMPALEQGLEVSREALRGAESQLDRARRRWANDLTQLAKFGRTLETVLPGSEARVNAILSGAEKGADPAGGLRSFGREATQSFADGDLAHASALVDDDHARAKSGLAGIEQEQRATRDSGAKASLPPSVAIALKVLNQKLPEALARPLSDVVRPASQSSPEWVRAIELAMGAKRFTLVVESGFELNASKLLQAEAAQFSSAPGPAPSIARNDKNRIDAKRSRILPARSALNELDCDDPQALRHLRETIGSLVKCDTDEEMLAEPRGLAKDGRTLSPTLINVSKPARDFALVFGAAAAQEAAAAKARRADELRAQVGRLGERRQEISSAREAANTIAELEGDLASWTQWREAAGEREAALAAKDLAEDALKSAMAELDAGDGAKQIERAEADLTAARSALKSLEAQRDVAIRTASNHKGGMTSTEKLVPEAARRAADLDAHAAKKASDARDWRAAGGFEWDELLSKLEALGQQPLAAQIDARDSEREELFSSWSQAVSDHNRIEALPAELTLRAASIIRGEAASKESAEALAETREREGVCGKMRDAQGRADYAKARASMETILRSELIERTLNASREIDIGVAKVNQTFRQAQFDGQEFELTRERKTEYVKRLEGFAQIKEAVGADGAIHWDKVSTEHRQTFEHLARLAQAADKDSMRMLAALCDPLVGSFFDINCHRVFMDPASGRETRMFSFSVAKQKTTSGGETRWIYILLQTLIACAHGQVGAKAQRGRIPIRMIELDEAFDKLALHRARSLMEFFENTLGLQVIAVTPLLKYDNLMMLFPRSLMVNKLPRTKPGNPSGSILMAHSLDREAFRQDVDRSRYAHLLQGFELESQERDLDEIMTHESFKIAISSPDAEPEERLVAEIVSASRAGGSAASLETS